MTIKKHLYQIKISLKWSKPAIWRRVLISSDTTLAQLHHIIQKVMPWEDYHLHRFDDGQIYYGVPDPEMDIVDETTVQVNKVLPKEKSKLFYTYDFGDSWDHEIILEKILPFDAQQKVPKCLKAVRAAPPEDSGGIGGYEYMLEVLQDHTHPEYQDMMAWLGFSEAEVEFDPSFVDVTAINKQLSLL